MIKDGYFNMTKKDRNECKRQDIQKVEDHLSHKKSKFMSEVVLLPVLGNKLNKILTPL